MIAISSVSESRRVVHVETVLATTSPLTVVEISIDDAETTDNRISDAQICSATLAFVRCYQSFSEPALGGLRSATTH